MILKNVISGSGLGRQFDPESKLDLFRVLRQDYIQKHTVGLQVKTNARDPRESESVSDLIRSQLNQEIDRHKLDWGDVAFHLNYRIQDAAELIRVFPEFADRRAAMERCTANGFRLSVLPLNTMLPSEVLENFIPPDDYFTAHRSKHTDPYGIFSKKARVVDEDAGLLLGSRKFRNSLLMNIHGTCPIGCSDCYKGYYTREQHDLGVTLSTLSAQSQAVVKWLNGNPDILDLIVSGGEPLLASNQAISNMLGHLERAQHLRVLRICTGTIFLGLPMRIDDELLDSLREFSDRTGVLVRFHANLYNHYQLTPEAMLAVRRIRQRAFSVYTQVPIKEGVNFFTHDIAKTIEFWNRLTMDQVQLGAEPYKFIVDMHPRTNQYYVPIEPLIKVWSRFAESHTIPEIFRPKTLSVLFRGGNIVLSGHSLAAMSKEIDRAKDVVKYYIPSSFSAGVFVYEEPLMASNKDPQSLSDLQKSWQSRIRKRARKSGGGVLSRHGRLGGTGENR